MSQLCLMCMTSLKGRQRKFCSRKCKNDLNNRNHQSYKAQQLRGRRRKLQLIDLAGGKCVRCGYDSNFAAMEFHHVDPAVKNFSLDLRSLSNRRWEYVLQEVKKCILMCSNCHAEEHNPDSFLT